MSMSLTMTATIVMTGLINMWVMPMYLMLDGGTCPLCA